MTSKTLGIAAALLISAAAAPASAQFAPYENCGDLYNRTMAAYQTFGPQSPQYAQMLNDYSGRCLGGGPPPGYPYAQPGPPGPYPYGQPGPIDPSGAIVGGIIGGVVGGALSDHDRREHRRPHREDRRDRRDRHDGGPR